MINAEEYFNSDDNKKTLPKAEILINHKTTGAIFVPWLLKNLIMKYFNIILLFSMLTFACGENKNKELPVQTEKVSGSLLRSSFKVWGNCDMCKETIEGSLKKDGIEEANWNDETKIISVTYDSSKINLDAIEKNIAAVGYDNAKYKGNDKAYAELPECCKYERK